MADFASKLRDPAAGSAAPPMDLDSWSTKYRPRSLKQVVGQPTVVAQLQRAFERRSLPRTILLTGPTGSGKTTLARIIAATANGVAPDGPATSDVMEIDAGSDGGIDTIRGLKDMAHHMPQFGAFRIYILDECHKLTGAAKSAALKLTEEPPARSMFLLLTNHPEDLPQELFDRGLHLCLGPCEPAALLPYLAWIGRSENVFQPAAQHERIYRLCAESSGGTPRAAVQLLQSVSLLDGSGDPDQIFQAAVRAYGRPSDTVAMQILGGIYAGAPAMVVAGLSGRPDMGQVLRSLIYLNQAAIEDVTQQLKYPPVLWRRFTDWMGRNNTQAPVLDRLFRIHAEVATLLDSGYSTSAKQAFYLGRLGALATG